jgi:gas vesicle protein
MKDKKTKKPSTFKRAKKTASIATVAMALGGIIGVTVGLLKAPKKGSEFKDEVTKEGQKLWKQLKITKKQAEEMVEKTFGEVSPEAMRMFTKAKSEVLARVAKSKKTLNKKEYEKIVDTVMKQVSKSKKLQPKLKKLGKELKGMWKNLSDLI